MSTGPEDSSRPLLRQIESCLDTYQQTKDQRLLMEALERVRALEQTIGHMIGTALENTPRAATTQDAC
jgi:hypothetical protein